MTEKAEALALYQGLESSLATLKQILLEELNALKSNDIAALTALTGQKNAAYAAVEESTRTLSPPLSAKHVHADEALAALQQRIVEQTSACQQINNRSGALLTQLSRHTTRSLAILRGEGENQTGTYGPDGLSQHEVSRLSNTTSA